MKAIVKNNVAKPFETVFLIVYGYLITEQIKNVIHFFSETPIIGSKLLLSLVSFLFLFLSVLEAVLYYSTTDDELESKKVKHIIVLYIVWFLQFLPLYYIIEVFNNTTKEIQMSKRIAWGFGSIYFVYFVYNIVQLFDKTLSKKTYIKHAIFYCFLFSLLWVYSALVSLFNYPIYILSVIILIAIILYVFYWKQFYLKLLFAPK